VEVSAFRFAPAVFVSNPASWTESLAAITEADAEYYRQTDGSYYIPMVFVVMRDQFYVFLVLMTMNGPISAKAFSNN
jgi:hypothetical protein